MPPQAKLTNPERAAALSLARPELTIARRAILGATLDRRFGEARSDHIHAVAERLSRRRRHVAQRGA